MSQKDLPKRKFDPFLPIRILVGAALALLVILTLAQVFCRYVLDSSILWSEELSRLVVVWMTFIGASAVCWQGRHLAVDVFFNILPNRTRKGVGMLNQVLAIGFLGVMTCKSIRIVRLENFQDMSALPLPQGTVRLAATVGGALMILAILAQFFFVRHFHASKSDTDDNSAM